MERDKTLSLSRKALFISLLVIVPLILLLAVDSFGNSATVFKFTGIQSYQFVIPSILLLLLLRWKWGVFLHPRVNSFFRFVLVAGLIITTLLTVYGAFTHANAVFSLTRINKANFLLLTITVGILFFLNRSIGWWHRHGKKMIFSTPFIFLYLAVITRLFPFDVFLRLIKEDHFIEYTQFAVLVLGSLISFFIAYHLKRNRNFLFSIFFIPSGLIFFLIAGDEIAWGQRLFSIEVSEAIKHANRQDELTVHNLNIVEWLVVYGYFVISALGLFSRYLCNKVWFLNKFIEFTPSYLLLGYFLFPFIFYFMQLKVEGGFWHSWAEVAELYFYSGLVLWVALIGHNFLKAPRKVKL